MWRNFVTPIAAVILSLIHLSLTAPPNPAASDRPSGMIPATPRYDLQCVDYEPGFQAGDPRICQNLVFETIPSLGDPPRNQFTFTNHFLSTGSFGYVPFDLEYPSDGPAAWLKSNLTRPSNSTFTGHGNENDDVCYARFSFRGVGPAEIHDERWTIDQLRKYALIAWATCMAPPDKPLPNPPKRAIMTPLPRSSHYKLVFEMWATKRGFQPSQNEGQGHEMEGANSTEVEMFS